MQDWGLTSIQALTLIVIELQDSASCGCRASSSVAKVVAVLQRRATPHAARQAGGRPRQVQPQDTNNSESETGFTA